MIRTCQNLEKHQFNMAWIIRKNCLFFSCVCVDSPLLPSPYPVPPLMRIQYAICRYTLAAGLTLPSPQPSPPQTDCLLPATPHHFRARRVPLLHNMNEIENEWTIFFSFLLYYYIHLDMTWEITVYLQRTYVRCVRGLEAHLFIDGCSPRYIRFCRFLHTQTEKEEIVAKPARNAMARHGNHSCGFPRTTMTRKLFALTPLVRLGPIIFLRAALISWMNEFDFVTAIFIGKL